MTREQNIRKKEAEDKNKRYETFKTIISLTIFGICSTYVLGVLVHETFNIKVWNIKKTLLIFSNYVGIVIMVYIYKLMKSWEK